MAKLPPERQYWGPVTTEFWIKYYGTFDPARLLALLQRDNPDMQYRLRAGKLEVLVDEEDEDE